MSHIDEHGRPEPPIAADETATLLGYLDYQRATLEWKTRGLDAAGLRRTLASSTRDFRSVVMRRDSHADLTASTCLC